MISGKLLVVVSDYHGRCPCIRLFTQSCSDEDAAEGAFQEAVETHLFLDIKGYLSKRQMKMSEGATIRLAINCTVSFHTDYWGECDSHLEVHKLHTLREQRPNAKLRRKWKLRDKQAKRQATS